MNIPSHRPYQIGGRTASELVRSIEHAIVQGQIGPGERLPAVRELASRAGLSPATVALAYRDLRRRGVTTGSGRGGTRVRDRPPFALRAALCVPPGVRDLLSGEPDPALLPGSPQLSMSRRSYSGPPVSPRLRRVAAESLLADGVDPSHLAVVGGALDGVERALAACVRVGDPVAVEDPCYPAVLDLLAVMGLEALPVALDGRGAVPASLQQALGAGAKAVVLTPRAQNPTGAAWDSERAASLRGVVEAHRAVLVVEDDHAGPVAGAAVHTLAGVSEHWVVVRSVSKWLGPDFRLAILAGDEATVARVQGRQALGTGWVSYTLQDGAAEVWSAPATARLLERAAATYGERRQALHELLQREGHFVEGCSGFTTWAPVADELGVVNGLLEAGWAVAPGERYRVASRPAVRIAHSTLEPADAARFVADLSRVARKPPSRSA